MRGRIFLSLALAGALSAASALAAELTLKPVPAASQPSPQSLQASSDLVDVSLFGGQVFELLSGPHRLGIVAAGEGRRKDSDGPPVCFVALVRDGAAQVVKTIGLGDWEAETCLGAAAIGPVKGAGSDARLAVIFKAASPNAEAMEPIVVRIPAQAGQPMSIDAAATKAASLAGAVTIKAVAKAIR